MTIVGLLVAAADSFSVWLINGALDCNVAADSACFGEGITSCSRSPPTRPRGSWSSPHHHPGTHRVPGGRVPDRADGGARGMLVILTGILPLSASFTNTEMGKNWFRKCVSWLVAFILYKPAAAIVYAAAFQLVGQGSFEDDGSGLLAVLTGLMLMTIALFAMPALMRFVTPWWARWQRVPAALPSGGALAALPAGGGDRPHGLGQWVRIGVDGEQRPGWHAGSVWG
ncbi:hypothetical protein NKG05_30670 [Oerskovia sp. M15]